jgi:hypothetical protein
METIGSCCCCQGCWRWYGFGQLGNITFPLHLFVSACVLTLFLVL